MLYFTLLALYYDDRCNDRFSLKLPDKYIHVTLKWQRPLIVPLKVNSPHSIDGKVCMGKRLAVFRKKRVFITYTCTEVVSLVQENHNQRSERPCSKKCYPQARLHWNYVYV